MTWKIEKVDDFTGLEVIDETDGLVIANISGCTPDFESMVTAAPDLLEACRARLECDQVFEQGTGEWHQAVDCADAMMIDAIRKAEGVTI
jgi:hypothetical protein